MRLVITYLLFEIKLHILQVQQLPVLAIQSQQSPNVQPTMELTLTKRCKDMPVGTFVNNQPFCCNSNIYVVGQNEKQKATVLEYNPELDKWEVLPPPPVQYFTAASHKNNILVVGGRKKGKVVGTVYKFNMETQKWVEYCPPMPTAVCTPLVIEYEDYLIVAGSCYCENSQVNILNTTTNTWSDAWPLPTVDYYHAVVIEEYAYFIGQKTRTFLRTHLPALVSGIERSVWEKLGTVPLYYSIPVTNGDFLMTISGRVAIGALPSIDVHLYDRYSKHWLKVGNIPHPFTRDCYFVLHSDQMFILGGSNSILSPPNSVYAVNYMLNC